MTEIPIDWTKPIQFFNGEPVELLETRLDGTRVIFRPTEGQLICSVWEFQNDGRATPGSVGERGGYWIVNRPATPPPALEPMVTVKLGDDILFETPLRLMQLPPVTGESIE